MDKELAIRYFLSDGEDKQKLRAQFASQASSSISLLVDTALELFGKYSARRDLSRYSKDQLAQVEIPWWNWIDCIANPIIIDIYQVVEQAGENAVNVLVRITSEFKNNKRQMVALLVFLKFKSITQRAAQQLKDIFERTMVMHKNHSLGEKEFNLLTFGFVILLSRGPVDKELNDIKDGFVRKMFDGDPANFASQTRSGILLVLYNNT